MASSPTVLDVPQGPLLAPVLGRVVRLHGARAELDIDRLSDAVLLTDTLAAHVWDHTVDGRVRVAIHTDDGTLVLDVGPLVAGGAEGLLEAGDHPEFGSVFATLADTVAVRTDDDGDHLRLELTRRRASPR
jgi:hypothetical protein